MSKPVFLHDHTGINRSANPNHEIFFKVIGDDTDQLFDYFDIRVGHLEGFPLHVHVKQYETFHVVEGELLLQEAGEWSVAKKGDFVLVPKNIEHTYVNVRRTVAHSIGIVSPGGFEKFVAAMQAEQRRPGGPDPKVVEEAQVQYNQKFTGPGLAVVLRLIPEADKAATFEKELDALQGNWTLVGSEGLGHKTSDEEMQKHPGLAEIDGHKMRIFVKDMHDMEGVARFDPTVTPKTIDYLHLSDSDPDKGKMGLGIYELQGDTLRICWAVTGLKEGRPSQFSNGPDDNQAITTYVRQKD
jgi:uncharacterized protein (TIGR03067 family)